MSQKNILHEIHDSLDTLNRSERKVAEVILADPHTATRSSIAVLARASDVSEPTVNRFCKRFNMEGFPDFKLHLAQSLAVGVPYVNRNVEADDTAESYTVKILDATMAAMAQTREKIDPAVINQAVDQLIQAKQIIFCGLGASGSVAQDAQHKFFRFNIPVSAHVDVMMQRMVAASTGVGDVLVMISHTGRTLELIEVAQLARESGATVIGITCPDSPLAQHCSIVIDVEAAEDTDVYMPMTSRLIHLVVIDILATGVTLRRGPDFLKHLKRIKDSIKDTRLPPALR